MSEKLIITLDASQIHEFMTCEQRWHYGYVENLRLADMQTEAMDKGTLVHKLLETYYFYKAEDCDGLTQMQLGEKTVEAFKVNNYTGRAGFPKDTENFLINRFIAYLMYYSGNRDLEPITNNGVPGVELGFSKILFEDENVVYIVEGKIDLIHVVGENLAWTDHKSQDRLNNLYNFKPQFLTYAWATGYDYGGINYFGMQKEVKDYTFRRTFVHYPRWMRERWEGKMLKVFRQVEHMKRDPTCCGIEMNLNSCAGAFESHPCPFTQLCETENDEMRENIKAFKYKKVEKWSPWKIEENA